MKLYNSMGPNPHVVRMFLAEKGLDIPLEKVDLMGGENRREPFLTKNPAGQLPTLELEDGAAIAEITVICEYLEETHPNPPLIGTTPRERAETRMWVRRVDLNICEPMTSGFRYSQGLQLFQNRMRCLPEAADGLKAMAPLSPDRDSPWPISCSIASWSSASPSASRSTPTTRMWRPGLRG